MSVIDNLRGKVRPERTAADVQKQLDDAKRKHAALVEQRRELALQASDGSADAAAKLEQFRRTLALSAEGVADLEEALIGARQRDEQRLAANIAADHKRLMAKMAKAFELRDDAAKDFSIAAEALADAWKRMLQQSLQAELARPPHTSWWKGSALTNPSQLEDLVLLELNRVTAMAGASALPLERRIDAADMIEPLGPKLRQASQAALDALNGVK